MVDDIFFSKIYTPFLISPKGEMIFLAPAPLGKGREGGKILFTGF
jgi:hypothetical protein